jgi:hypothetical protein
METRKRSQGSYLPVWQWARWSHLVSGWPMGGPPSLSWAALPLVSQTDGPWSFGVMMRIEIGFAKPLNQATRRTAVVVLGTIAGVDRVVFASGDRVAMVLGEGVSTEFCEAALREMDLAWEWMDSSLHQDDATLLGAEVKAAERLRPMGR